MPSPLIETMNLGEVYGETEMLYNLDEQLFVTEKSKKHSPIQFAALGDKDLQIYKDYQNWCKTYNMTKDTPNPVFVNTQAKEKVSLLSFQRLHPGLWLQDEIINYVLFNIKTVIPHLRNPHFVGSIIDNKIFKKLDFKNNATNQDYLVLSTFFNDRFLKIPGNFKLDVQMLKWTFRALGLGQRDQQRIKITSVDDRLLGKIEKKLEEFEKILIPINIEEFHWYLVSIFPKQKLVLILDSLPTTVNRYQTTVQNICNWYNGINTILYGKAMPEKTMDSSWRVALNLKFSPRQSNDCDCGVFVLLYAIYIIRGQSLNFLNQYEAKQFRDTLIVLSIKRHDQEMHRKKDSSKYICESEKLTMKERVDELIAMMKIDQNNLIATQAIPQLPKKIKQDNRIKTLFQSIKGYSHVDLDKTQESLESLRFLHKKTCKQVYKSVHLQNQSKHTAEIPSFTTKPKREHFEEQDIEEIKNELKDLMSIRQLKCHNILITDAVFKGIDDCNHITDDGVVLLIRFLIPKCQGLEIDSFCVIESPSGLQLPFGIPDIGSDVRLIEEIEDWQSKESILLPILIRQDKPTEEEESDDNDNHDDEMYGGHWVLLVLYPKQKYLVLYDSEPHKDITEDDKTPPYIALVIAHFKINGWNVCLQAYGNLPQQTAHHCGLYMMYFMLCIISKTPIGTFTDEHAVNMRNWFFEMILDNHTNCGPKSNAKLSLATEADESSPKEDFLETNNGEMQVTSTRRIHLKVPEELKVTKEREKREQEATNLDSNANESKKIEETENENAEKDYGLQFESDDSIEPENEESDSKKANNKVNSNYNKSKEDTSKGKRKQILQLPTQGKRRKSSNDDHPEGKEEIKNKPSSGKQESTTTKETSNTENTKSHDEEHEDLKASQQLIQETIEKLKIQKLRQDQGLEIEDDFSGDSNIWIKSQINYYINQAKKERGIKTSNRESLESQMTIDTQSAVSREEILSCFNPEYRTLDMLKQQDYVSAMSYLARKTIDPESHLEVKVSRYAKKKIKDLASHQYDELVKKYFETVSPEEVIQHISTVDFFWHSDMRRF